MTAQERDAVQRARGRGDSDGDIRAMLEKMRGLPPGTLKAIPPAYDEDDEDPTAQAKGPYGEGQRPAPDEPATVPASPENVGREDEPWKRPDSRGPAPDAARNAEERAVQGGSRPHIPVEDADKLPPGQAPQIPETEATRDVARQRQEQEAQQRQQQREAEETASRQAQREARQQQRQEDKK